jgi:large subunit ribosomal protein L24
MLQMKRSSRKSKFTAFPLHVKTGDTVMVISGKSKGQTGIVRKVFTDRGRLVVDGLNKVKKATRPNPMAGIRGGIVEMEAPLAAAKVMLYCLQCSKPTRIKYENLADERKTRVCKHCQAQFDT